MWLKAEGFVDLVKQWWEQAGLQKCKGEEEVIIGEIQSLDYLTEKKSLVKEDSQKS